MINLKSTSGASVEIVEHVGSRALVIKPKVTFLELRLLDIGAPNRKIPYSQKGESI